MRLPKLDNRLACIYEMIGDAESVCDVGADHGRLALNLAKAGKKVIATDISEPSLQKTRKLAKLHNANVDCRLGDGLAVIKPGEAAACVIAGMGQNTIISIIEGARDVVEACDFIVVQSMNGEYDLRSFLSENEFAIIDERIIKESKRLYCVMKAKPGNGANLSELEKYLGPQLLETRQEHFGKYLETKIAILSEIVCGMERAGDTKSTRYVKIKEVLSEMEEVHSESI